MWVPVPYFQRVVSWYTQHRGEFSLLVHPNTGCENEGMNNANSIRLFIHLHSMLQCDTQIIAHGHNGLVSHGHLICLFSLH